jgi:hypothetical protein
MHFHSETLSQDARVHVLLRLAIWNMVSVQTLRIIYGHMRLASSLVAGFLNHDRPCRVPLRKLWLESCSLSPYAMRFLASSSVTGLVSLRIRRLDATPFTSTCDNEVGPNEFKLSRGGERYNVHDGAGNWVLTTVQPNESDQNGEFPLSSAMDMMRLQARSFDIEAWNDLRDVEDFLGAKQLPDMDEEMSTGPAPSMQGLLEHSAATLTSLNLDWLLWRRRSSDSDDNATTLLNHLATLRFPHLRAFQIRNAVLPQTLLPQGFYLLEETFLEFMVHHQKIQCLAWPMDRIYGHTRPSAYVQNRTRSLIAHLASILTDLRIDASYTGDGESLTDTSETRLEVEQRIRRRRFIAEFAPHMRRIERLKMEGGLPRDEKRELLRALHYCPLKKIVMIGMSYPVGNTWGPHGIDMKAIEGVPDWEDLQHLEGEDAQGIQESYRRGSYLPENFNFDATYGWPTVQVPLLQTIALHHAKTVEELKLCGYNGSPILSQATPITDLLLNSLRHFDNLKQLVMSFWLLTWFEDDYRDTEIIKFWTDSRSPSSTALVVVTPPRSPDLVDHPVDPGQFLNIGGGHAPAPQFNRWAVALKTSFSPSALAYRVARDIGPYLSPIAKNRPGGVRVRASFCVGIKIDVRPAQDIFDMDLRIGKNDQVLEFTGPREEEEPSRWRQKLERRSWF